MTVGGGPMLVDVAHPQLGGPVVNPRRRTVRFGGLPVPGRRRCVCLFGTLVCGLRPLLGLGGIGVGGVDPGGELLAPAVQLGGTCLRAASRIAGTLHTCDRKPIPRFALPRLTAWET
jgi:hypothetical protein